MSAEIVVDNFAGGGGASTGIERALGRPVDVALNHDPFALAIHEANHPKTRHLCQSITAVDPLDVTRGRKVGLAWFSPDCTHHSKASGAAPKSKRVRDLAWVVIHWAQRIRPRIIMLENVEEIQQWGPLLPNGQPDPAQRGVEWERWLKAFRAAGYVVEYRELKAMRFGTPTSRNRLFLIARCDRRPIVWPAETHGEGLLPYRTAAECINWTIPCPSIFERKKPLADSTLRRIARGMFRYVIQANRPFIVPVTHQGGDRCYSVDKPLNTVTSANRGELSLVTPFITGAGGAEYAGRPRDIDQPLNTITGHNRQAVITPLLMDYLNDSAKPPEEPIATITTHDHHALIAPHLSVQQSGHRGREMSEPISTLTTANHHALVSGFIVPSYSERDGQLPRCQSVEQPIPTIVPTNNSGRLVSAWMVQHNTGSVGHTCTEPVSTLTKWCTQQQIVTSNLLVYRNNVDMASVEEPLGTICSKGYHFSEVRSFLRAYHGPELDPFAVHIDGREYRIVDIGMRMLTPRELYLAQGFPPDYILDPIYNGKRLSKTAQVHCCGNSVCPPVAEALVRANVVLDECVAKSARTYARSPRKVAGQGVFA